MPRDIISIILAETHFDMVCSTSSRWARPGRPVPLVLAQDAGLDSRARVGGIRHQPVLAKEGEPPPRARHRGVEVWQLAEGGRRSKRKGEVADEQPATSAAGPSRHGSGEIRAQLALIRAQLHREAPRLGPGAAHAAGGAPGAQDAVLMPQPVELVVGPFVDGREARVEVHWPPLSARRAGAKVSVEVQVWGGYMWCGG